MTKRERLVGEIFGNRQIINGMTFYLDNTDIDFRGFKPKHGHGGGHRGNTRTLHTDKFEKAQARYKRYQEAGLLDLDF